MTIKRKRKKVDNQEQLDETEGCGRRAYRCHDARGGAAGHGQARRATTYRRNTAANVVARSTCCSWAISLTSQRAKSGTSGPDTLVGTNAADAIYGYRGNDKMDGRGGNDELRGGRVADRIEGGNGSDTVYAGRGADFVNVRGDYSRDYVYCGAGVDTVNNMPGPGPAHFFAADCEECV